MQALLGLVFGILFGWVLGLSSLGRWVQRQQQAGKRVPVTYNSVQYYVVCADEWVSLSIDARMWRNHESLRNLGQQRDEGH